MRAQDKRLAVFLGVTFAVTWGAWIPLAVAGHGVTVGFAPIYLLGLLGPMIGAFAATATQGRRGDIRALLARMGRVRVGARWWAVALGLPLGIAVVLGAGQLLTSTFGFAHAGHDLGAFNGFPHTSPLVLWAMLVLVNGFGEETGWRGYLLPLLERRRSPFRASLVIAGIWALWHVPAFFVTETYREMPSAMIPMFFIGLASGSVFLAWLHDRGRASVLLVAVWHGTYNWLSGSVGARGALAAVESTAVMMIAALLVIPRVRERVWRFRAATA